MADEPEARSDPSAGAGRPPPPRLRQVAGVGLLVVAFVLVAPALYAAGRDLTGSRVLGLLGLLPPAAALALLYAGLFRR